jgi:phage shock protein PspC (stress-responsive transcriptional regulator)
MVQKKKRLYSVRDGVFGGVCGGIADYWDFDPVFLRVPLFLPIFCRGFGLLIYFAFWLSMPYAPEEQ